MSEKLAKDKITPMEYLRGCLFDDGKLHKGLDDFESVGGNPDEVSERIHIRCF